MNKLSPMQVPSASNKKLVTLLPDELAFMQNKLQKERNQYWVVIRSLVILGLLVSGLTTVFFKLIKPDADWQKQMVENNFPDYYYVLMTVFVVGTIIVAAIFAYWMTLRKVSQDCKQGLKVVECTNITKKVFMPRNNTFHFYLNSAVKLNIPVSQKDYEQYQIGDEINIQYTVHSLEYLGYF